MAKPECISADTLRATARAAGSADHSPAAGNFSFTYSMIASESHTVSAPSFRIGTRPAAECGAICAAVSG